MYNLYASYQEFTKFGSHDPVNKLFYLFIILFVSIFLAAFLQLLFHEAGHYLFGIMTGYRFLSFRIFQMTLIRAEGRIKLKKYNYPGTTGQCIMKPPDLKTKKPRFGLHIMGGVIMNFITAFLSLLLSYSPLNISLNFRMILLVNTFMGFGLALTQGIPCRHGRINNDGTTLLSLIRDKQAAKCYYLQLSILGKLQEGAAYKQLGDEIFQLPEKADLINAIFGWHKILQCYYYMDLRLWNKAEECLEAFQPVLNKLSGSLKYSVLMEMLFIRIINNSSSYEIESLFQKTKKLLYCPKADFHIIRVRMAYEIYKSTLNGNKKESLDSLFISHNRENIRSKIQRELVIRAVSYPYVGEASFCTGIIYEILNNY